MSTIQKEPYINENDSVQNSRTKSNKSTNNINKQQNIDNNLYSHTNPPKISLRNHANKKENSKKDLSNHQENSNKLYDNQSCSILSQKDKQSQNKSNSSYRQKEHKNQTKQNNNERQKRDKYGPNVNKIHFQSKNNVFLDINDNQSNNTTKKGEYLSSKQHPFNNFPNVPCNLPPPIGNFNVYNHHHTNSTSNINNFDNFNKNLYSHKQEYKPSQSYNQHYEQHFIGQNSNKKSVNSMSITREQLNCSQSAKNSNSSSFYDNNTSFNIITPIISHNSLQHYNDSSQQSPAHFYFKGNPNTHNLQNQQINSDHYHYGPQSNQNKYFTKYQNNPSFQSNYYQNFTKTSPHQDSALASKYSFPVNQPYLKGNLQQNSKSNLVIRNFQYGRNLQPVQRTKSHTKNFSNNDVLESQKACHLTQNSQNLYKVNTNVQNQPHYMAKQNQNSYRQNTQKNFHGNQNNQGSLKSNNPYIINLITNINKSAQKAYPLDEIAEKDQFGRVFVRGNQKNCEKSESGQSNKYIQRQQDMSNKSAKQKISIISDSLKSQYQGPGQYIQINQSPNHLTNLRYIKNGVSNEVQAKGQYIQLESQNIRNCDKYLKVNYQPLLKIQKSNEQSFKQNQIMQTQSVNSSFKQNKSQTRSLHGNAKNKHQSANNIDKNQKNKNKNSTHQRQNHFDTSTSKNNLHQISTLPNQNAFSFQKLTPKTKIHPQYDPQSYSLQPQENIHHQDLYPPSYYPDKQPNLNNEKKFSSPDSKQFQRSGNYNQNMHTSQQQEYAGQKLTLFSPKQKDFRPVQKSHFIQQDQSENYRESMRQKKSIKKMLVSQSKGFYNKPQVFVSLNFKDLLKGQNQQGRPNSRTLLQAITKNHLTKVFCSTFKIGENQNGCDCVPKCYWVDQWLEIINNNRKLKQRSLMKNIDRNKLFNFSGQNIWKNKSQGQKGNANPQVMSFKDMEKLSNLNSDEIETFKQIEKDVPRTFSSHPTFKNQKFREFLREVLIHSYYLDTQLGYVQGMNIITASIIYHSKTTDQALQLVDLIMNILDFKKIYMNEMKKCRDLALKTCQVIRINCNDMYTHVVIDNQVDLEMFIVGWYFSMLGTFVPLEAMHLVINKFIQKQFGGIMKIIVTFFIFIKDILMQKNDPNQIMQELSVQSMIDRSVKIDWNELISVSDKLKLSLDKEEF